MSFSQRKPRADAVAKISTDSLLAASHTTLSPKPSRVVAKNLLTSVGAAVASTIGAALVLGINLAALFLTLQILASLVRALLN